MKTSNVAPGEWMFRRVGLPVPKDRVALEWYEREREMRCDLWYEGVVFKIFERETDATRPAEGAS